MMEPLFDRPLYLAKQARHLISGNDLSQHLARELAERLSLMNRKFSHGLIIGYDAPFFAETIQATGQVETLTVKAADPSPDLQLAHATYDVIFHLLDLQAENDVPGILAQLHRALKPDGLLLACLFASHSLNELRQAWLSAEMASLGGVSPRIAPMIDVRELGGLLQRAQFALPVVDLDRLTLRYDNALKLLQDIKQQGLSLRLLNGPEKPASRRLLHALMAAYAENFADPDGRIRATVEIAWLTAWSPHESQQKPLKPGSATMRLEDALRQLKTSEEN